MSCCVFGCNDNPLQEWTTEFPRERDLTERWRASIRAATGQCPSDEEVQNGALICNVHFEMLEPADGSTEYIEVHRVPSLFVRDHIQLQVACCQLCYRYDTTDNMFDIGDSLVQGLSLRWMTNKYFGRAESPEGPERDRKEYFCEICTVQIDITHSFWLFMNQRQAHRQQEEERIKNHEDPIITEEEPQIVEPPEKVLAAPKKSRKNVHKCFTCDKTFFNRDNLIRHQKSIKHVNVNADGTPLVSRSGGQLRKVPTCNLCQATFQHSKQLSTHFKVVHPETKLTAYPCGKCDEVFFTSLSLRQHAYIHTDVYQCETCGERHSMKRYLDMHRHTAHAVPHKTVQCPICDKMIIDYAYRTHLRNHERPANKTRRRLKPKGRAKRFDGSSGGTGGKTVVNTEEKRPWKCLTCNMSFRERYYLKIHELSMKHLNATTNEKLLATRKGGPNRNQPTCNLCQATFTHSKEVVTHFEQVHPDTALKIYPCRKCDEVFFVFASLRHHSYIHSSTYGCVQCGKRHHSRRDLYAHRHSAHGVQRKTIKCHICNRDCADYSYKEHMRYHEKRKLHMSLNKTRKKVVLKKARIIIKDELKLDDNGKLSVSQQQGDTGEHVGEGESPRVAEPSNESEAQNKDFQDKCLLCEKSFFNKDSLKRHEKSSLMHVEALNETPLATRYGGEGQNVPTCMVCQATFEQSKEIQAHFKSIHPELEFDCYPCAKCDEVYFGQVSSRNHSYTHTETHQCDQCGRRFITIMSLAIHRHSAHNDPNVVCPICSQECSRGSSYISHLRKHKSHKKPKQKVVLKCLVCNKSFKNRDSLKRHEKSIKHSNISTGKAVTVALTCLSCNKSFKNRDSLKRHEMSLKHRNIKVEKPLASRKGGARKNVPTCNLCQATFQRAKDIVIHFEEVHPETELQSYPCDRCSDVFFAINSFRHHMIIHTDNYKCEDCDRRHKSRRDLDIHRHLAHGAPRKFVKCPICERQCIDYLIGTHIRRHKTHPLRKKVVKRRKRIKVEAADDEPKPADSDGPKEFNCMICDKSFYNNDSLKRHEKSIMHINTLAENPLATRTGGKTRNVPTCNVCQATFEQSKDILTHFSEIHPETELLFYTCKECEEVFFGMMSFKTHLYIHKDTFLCEQCGKRHTSKRDLIMHRRTDHGLQREVVACHICNKTCTRGSSFNSHMRAHRYDRKSLRRKARRNVDQRSAGSTVKQEFTDAELTVAEAISGPSKGQPEPDWIVHLEDIIVKEEPQFAEPSDRNQALHEGGQIRNKFVCMTCNVYFSSNTNLRQHEREQHCDKKCHCYTCKKSFGSLQELQHHNLKIHRDKRPYKCNLCGLSYGQRISLLNHMEIHNDGAPHQIVRYEFTKGKRFSSRLLWLPDEQHLYKKHSVYKTRYFYRCYEKNCNARVALTETGCTRNSESHNHPNNALLYNEIQARGPTRTSRVAAEAVPPFDGRFLELPCGVPGCFNAFPGRKTAFPRDKELQTCWKTAIEVGTGKHVLDVTGGVCDLHFATQELEDYKEPTIFYRNNIRLEVGYCQLCLRYDIKDSLINEHTQLVDWLARKFVGIGKSGIESRNETSICEECFVKIDMIRAIVHQMENDSSKLVTLLKKKTKESIRLRNTCYGGQDLSPVNQNFLTESGNDSFLVKPRAGARNEQAGYSDALIKEKPHTDKSDVTVTVLNEKPSYAQCESAERVRTPAKLSIPSKPMEQYSEPKDEDVIGNSSTVTIKEEPQATESDADDAFEFVIVKEEPTLYEAIPQQIDEPSEIAQTYARFITSNPTPGSSPANQLCRTELNNDSILMEEYSEPSNGNMTEVFAKIKEQPNQVSDREKLFEVIVVKEEPLLVESESPEMLQIPEKSKPVITSMQPSIPKCFICNTTMKCQKSLCQHLRAHRCPEEGYLCKECKLTFNKNIAFNAHLSMHDREKQFQCSHCPLKFVGRRAKRLHEADKHGIDNEIISFNTARTAALQTLACSTCGQTCSNLKKLKLHEHIHDSNYSKQYTCLTCGQKNQTSQELNQHKLEHQSCKTQRLPCHKCSKTFGSLLDLQHHVMSPLSPCSKRVSEDTTTRQQQEDQRNRASTEKRSRTIRSDTFS